MSGAPAHSVAMQAEGCAQLDAVALDRLRELDPMGSSHLIERVFAAFETSLSRLRPQLEAARRDADASTIRLVAHTLKSSSAIIGALRLSSLCADVEQLAKERHIDEASEKITALVHETDAVLRALRRVPDTGL